MGIYLFAKPKKMAAEGWLNTIAEVISDTYELDSNEEKAVKNALYNGSNSEGEITYKKFIDVLKDEKALGIPTMEEVPPIGDFVVSEICPVMLKKNNWTTFFDDKEGKGLEQLSAKALRNALKNAYDQKFIDFVICLWVKVNLPELYENITLI